MTNVEKQRFNEVEFHKNIKEPDELADLIEKFKLRTSDLIDNINDSVFGEKSSRDRLIVIDNVTGVADNCKKFAEFFTVCRKYKYHCIYVFHVITSETQIWKKNLSQINIFNIFLRVYLIILYQKYYKVAANKHAKNIFQRVLCGYIGSLLTLLIPIKEIA